MKMKLIGLTLIWFLYVLADYFILPYFVQPFFWLFVCLALLIHAIGQLLKLYRECKNLKSNRIAQLLLTATLFFLSFYNFSEIPNFLIEKIDWTISYNRRIAIKIDVMNEILKPNSDLNNGICELPFDFPIISNGGNEILIYDGTDNNTKTIKFWISRGFFESPQTYFIFTNDTERKEYYEKLISNNPEFNWKLEENWYRIMEQY